MSDIDPERARDTADEILSRREFREEPPTLVERILDRLFEELGQFLSVAFGGGRGLWFGYLVLGFGVCLALYFLVRHNRWGRLGSSQGLVGVELETVDTRSPDRAEWLSRATEAEQAGQWRRAVYARYRALTAGLAASDELSADRSVTSGEHRTTFSAAAKAEPERVASFEGATDCYEQVWFGGQAADQPDAAAMAGADQVVVGTNRSGRSRA
ncbi:MAG: DUF4129 domain-containing protein [Actinomycetia bacterium]|nr:DUF4129 domain-containing protein [Actinomycetes bacterium]